MTPPSAAPYVPAYLPQGPAPAHRLTLTITAAREGGFEVDAQCGCDFTTPVRPYQTAGGFQVTGHRGWSALYGADDDGRELESATAEAVAHWTRHRESCARRFGPAALR